MPSKRNSLNETIVKDIQHGRELLKTNNHEDTFYLFPPDALETLISENETPFLRGCIRFVENKQKFTLLTLMNYFKCINVDSFHPNAFDDFTAKEIKELLEKYCRPWPHDGGYRHVFPTIVERIPLFSMEDIDMIGEGVRHFYWTLTRNPRYAINHSFLNLCFRQGAIGDISNKISCHWVRLAEIIDINWVNNSVRYLPDSFIMTIAGTDSRSDLNVSDDFIEALLIAVDRDAIGTKTYHKSPIYINLTDEQVHKYAARLHRKFILWGKMNVLYNIPQEEIHSIASYELLGHLPLNAAIAHLISIAPLRINSPTLVHVDRAMLKAHYVKWNQFIDTPQMWPLMKIAAELQVPIGLDYFATPASTFNKQMAEWLLFNVEMEYLKQNTLCHIYGSLIRYDVLITMRGIGHVLREYKAAKLNRKKVDLQAIVQHLLADSRIVEEMKKNCFVGMPIT